MKQLLLSILVVTWHIPMSVYGQDLKTAPLPTVQAWRAWLWQPHKTGGKAVAWKNTFVKHMDKLNDYDTSKPDRPKDYPWVFMQTHLTTNQNIA